MAKQDVSFQYLENKLSRNPRSLVFSRLADCYRKKGEIQQAIGVCKQGLKIHPDYVTARVLLGRCYLEQEKLKEAVAEFVKAVELDRRNQIAVKMIADVYTRQGMREKAGDLYNYLVRMDPDNQSLVRLTAGFKGAGATDIHDILGIGPTGAAQEKVSADIIIDADRTIQMDIAKRGPEAVFQETGDLSEILVKTQKYDAEELVAADDVKTPEVEEIGVDDQKTESGLVTGDDISSRMAMIFGEEEKGEASGAAEETIEAPGGPAIDIEEEKTVEQAPAEADFTQLFEAHEETAHKGEDTEAPASLPTEEMKLKDIVPEDTSIPGDDITGRLGEMFEESHPADVLETLDVKEEEPAAPTAAEPAEKATDTDVAPVAADAVRIEEASDDQTLSGEDVAFRLETIFEEGEEEEKVAAMPTEEEPLPEMEDEKKSKPEEDTKTPFGMGGERVVVADDGPQERKKPEEDTLSESETIAVSARTLQSPKAGSDDLKKAQAAPPGEVFIDDIVTPEEEPGMSGDDVAGRLDELFPEDLEKDVTGLASIPDEEKDEEAVGQGFYTMSGENARQTPSDDALLEELDKVEIDGADRPQDRIEMMAPDETVRNDDDMEKTRPADRPYPIPDHVLTPTLADIYFQQGQPQLAMQIYKRLLEADPDNERIAQRLKEIEAHIEAISGQETIAFGATPPARRQSRVSAGRRAPSRRKQSILMRNHWPACGSRKNSRAGSGKNDSKKTDPWSE